VLRDESCSGRLPVLTPKNSGNGPANLCKNGIELLVLPRLSVLKSNVLRAHIGDGV
jgi:hypothetical protein